MQTKCCVTTGPSNGAKEENFSIHEDPFDELEDLLTYECLITGKKNGAHHSPGKMTIAKEPAGVLAAKTCQPEFYY